MTYSESFVIPAKAHEVFDALLDEEVLGTWLAEHVVVEPRKGGAYNFWGRDVIWGGKRDDAQGEILELERPHALAFSWLWKGHASQVSLRLSESGRGESQLAVEHSFESFDPGSEGPGPDMAGCHWRIAIGNLIAVLAGGRAQLRPDYSVETSHAAGQVDLEIVIEAPPAKVFRALLDPEKLRVWMQVEKPEVDTQASRYSYGWLRGDPPVEVGPTRILELVPDRLLVHDWQWTDEHSGQVRWELTPSDFGTRLRLIHVRARDVSYVLGWSDALVGIRRLFGAPS